MSGKKNTNEMVATNSKYKGISCSTPEHRLDSPSRDSDSEAASPVPFLCTQDGADGEIDVVWNYNNTSSNTRIPKNTTPLSRKTKKIIRPKLQEKSLPKRRITRLNQKNNFLQELIELNQNINNLLQKKSKPNNADKPKSGSDEDMFSEGIDCSPKSLQRTSSQCLRKNVLSSKFTKPEADNGLESDDSINECLLTASQVVEENTFINEVPAKRRCVEPERCEVASIDLTMDEDSMDANLKNISSPYINKLNSNSPGLNNDSFDSLVGNLNDSALDRLTQMPTQHQSSRRRRRTSSKDSNWLVKEVVVHDGSPTKLSLARHSSMPVSPSVHNYCEPSTSSVSFARYNSMPFNKSDKKITSLSDSPTKCSRTEIEKKRQQAREKLLAKRLLPFTPTKQVDQSSSAPRSKPVSEHIQKFKFQPKVPSSTVTTCVRTETVTKPNQSTVNVTATIDSQLSDSENIKARIEKKRQEALMKLQRRKLCPAEIRKTK